MKKAPISLAAALVALFASTVVAQPIQQARGSDPRVDYAELKQFGPWDDRNYDLRLDDLSVLGNAADELAQSEAIPAFYRVELRKQYDFPKAGRVLYPRSGLPSFFNEYIGYLYEGRYYRRATRQAGQWSLDLAAESFDDESYLGFLEGEVRVTSPNGAAESAIAINPVDTDIVIAGSNGPGGGQKMHYSSDGGASWTQAPSLSGSCCDPTVGWSSDGSIGYTSTLQIPELFFYRTLDNGQTWVGPIQVDNDSGFVDKQFLHVDIHPTSPHLDTLYHTWHESNSMKFSRSTDFGLTWSAEQTLSSGAGESGIGSDIATDAAGNVYYFWPAFNSRKILVRKSSDGGANFAPTVEIADTEGSFIFPIPVFEVREVFIYVSADTDRTGGAFDGRVYAAWTDSTGPTTGNPTNNHARIQVAYSSDGGASWTVTTPHETADAGTVDRFHQWLSVAGDGSVHLIFYDTRRDLPNRNQVDIFRTVSTDGGATWSAPERVTAEQSPNIADGFEWGDYNGMDAVGTELISIWTDNRDEVGGDPQSVDVYAAGFLAGLFADGFESGDTSAWDTVIP